MKKILMYCVFFYAGSLRGYSQSKTFSLQMNFSPQANGSKVYLVAKAVSEKPLDSAVVKNGRVIFKYTTPFPQLFTIILQDSAEKSSARYIPVFIDEGEVSAKVTLDREMNASTILNPHKYPFDKLKVIGSPMHDQFVAFQKADKPLREEYLKVFSAGYSSNKSQDGKYLAPSAENIRLLDETDQALNRLTQFQIAYFVQHKNDLVALQLAFGAMTDFTAQQIDKVSKAFSPELMATLPGQKFKQKAELVKRTAIGGRLVDLNLQDQHGKPVKLSDYADKGRYTLIVFWASWCGPCRAEIPHLKKLYDIYHPAGFDIVSITMDDKKEYWLKAIESEKMEWPQACDPGRFEGSKGKIAETYNFPGIPTCILIGPSGEIISRSMRAARLDRKLIELYGNKFTSAN